MGFHDGSVLKNPPSNVEDLGSIPGSGRSPGGGNDNPLHYSCWEIPRTEELGGTRFTGSQRVEHNRVSTSATSLDLLSVKNRLKKLEGKFKYLV